MARRIIRDYQQPQERVFAAALQAVRELNYKIDNLDKASGLLNFKTQASWKSWAGQEMSILVVDNGNGTCTVDIAGSRRASGVFIQFYDWGEAAGIARKVFRRMERFLKK
jgi:hypothetical protein